MNVLLFQKKLVEKLANLRIAFADLSYQYKKELQSSPEAQLKLAEYLPQLFPHANFGCEFPVNFDILRKKISLFNICYLKEICTKFPPKVW